MQYRTLGKDKDSVSILGFGCMRLPVLDNAPKEIDETEAIRQIRYGIDQGINYIDTAYPYHYGKSEGLVGKALADGYRERVFLATKLPSYLIETRQDMDRYLDEQLERLQTDHIDFYLLHALNQKYWDNYVKLDVFDFIEKAINSGKIRNIGFSFHDDFSLFKKIVDSYNWDFCQIQLNFMDEDYQAGLAGLRYASERDIDVVIMEPLRGGKLAGNVPDDVNAIWQSYPVHHSPAGWALRYLWNYPEVKVVLSGMGQVDQIKDNIKEASAARSNMLDEKERALIQQVKDIYLSRTKVNCTNCKYCMPCPFGVNIPENFDYYNQAHMFGSIAAVRGQFEMFLKDDAKANRCTECGKCESLCPQQIPIRETLKDVTRTFSREIYLAGGCFWGLEEYFSRINGVTETIVGYANGDIDHPTYEDVKTSKTGYAETVLVRYDKTKVSLPFIIDMYLKVVDPYSINRQGGDTGPQYRTGIYYTSSLEEAPIRDILNQLESSSGQKVAIECEPLRNFYNAEQYHQDYLKKNPHGYCHIGSEMFEFAEKAVDESLLP